MSRDFCGIFYPFVYPTYLSNLPVDKLLPPVCPVLYWKGIVSCLNVRWIRTTAEKWERSVKDRKNIKGSSKKKLYATRSLLSHDWMRTEQEAISSPLPQLTSQPHPYLCVFGSHDGNERIGTDAGFPSEQNTDPYQANWRKQRYS